MINSKLHVFLFCTKIFYFDSRHFSPLLHLRSFGTSLLHTSFYKLFSHSQKKSPSALVRNYNSFLPAFHVFCSHNQICLLTQNRSPSLLVSSHLLFLGLSNFALFYVYEQSPISDSHTGSCNYGTNLLPFAESLHPLPSVHLLAQSRQMAQ